MKPGFLGAIAAAAIAQTAIAGGIFDPDTNKTIPILDPIAASIFTTRENDVTLMLSVYHAPTAGNFNTDLGMSSIHVKSLDFRRNRAAIATSIGVDKKADFPDVDRGGGDARKVALDALRVANLRKTELAPLKNAVAENIASVAEIGVKKHDVEMVLLLGAIRRFETKNQKVYAVWSDHNSVLPDGSTTNEAMNDGVNLEQRRYIKNINHPEHYRLVKLGSSVAKLTNPITFRGVQVPGELSDLAPLTQCATTTGKNTIQNTLIAPFSNAKSPCDGVFVPVEGSTSANMRSPTDSRIWFGVIVEPTFQLYGQDQDGLEQFPVAAKMGVLIDLEAKKIVKKIRLPAGNASDSAQYLTPFQ